MEELIEVIYRDLVMMVTAEYDKKMSLPTAVGISNSAGHGNGAPGPSRGMGCPRVSAVPTIHSPYRWRSRELLAPSRDSYSKGFLQIAVASRYLSIGLDLSPNLFYWQFCAG